MSDQIFRVAISPAQRFVLLNLSHAEGQELQGQRGRVFRRFVRAFGIEAPLAAAAKSPSGKVSTRLAMSTTPALFTLTAENVDYALGLLEVKRAPAVEMTIGPLFDALEDLKAGREYTPPEGIAEYDPAAEDWATPTTRPVEQKIADYLRAQGETRAAELVDQGGWDKPPAPNGATGKPEEPRTEA